MLSSYLQLDGPIFARKPIYSLETDLENYQLLVHITTRTCFLLYLKVDRQRYMGDKNGIQSTINQKVITAKQKSIVQEACWIVIQFAKIPRLLAPYHSLIHSRDFEADIYD
jgi:hypothetical protein